LLQETMTISDNHQDENGNGSGIKAASHFRLQGGW
jgi:hypothetical protein